MTIRRLVIAALLASAGAAHADTITSQSTTQPNFVTGWTTGNGTDVLGSGVLQGNLNLVGGVAHSAGSGSDAKLMDVLLGKVAGTVGKVDGQTTLFFQRGIEASYLLASGHGILAATLGPGKSVVASADGVIISDGLTKAPTMSGGGNQTVSTGGSGGTTTNATINTGVTNTGATNTGATNTGSTNTVTTGNGATNNGATGSDTTGNGNSGNGNSGKATGNTGADTGKPEVIWQPEQSNKPNDNGLAMPRLETPAAEVPEPSSIALMLLGMIGAGAMTRRRSR